MFASLYARVMHWAAHRHAPRYLAALSFAESSFFPVPPDVMLIPLCAAHPRKALRLGLLTTAFSTLGGLLGYAIGWFAFDLITPLLKDAGYWAQVLRVEGWFRQYGVWIVFVAGFSPLPYKVFTITAGAMSMPLDQTLGRMVRMVERVAGGCVAGLAERAWLMRVWRNSGLASLVMAFINGCPSLSTATIVDHCADGPMALISSTGTRSRWINRLVALMMACHHSSGSCSAPPFPTRWNGAGSNSQPTTSP